MTNACMVGDTTLEHSLNCELHMGTSHVPPPLSRWHQLQVNILILRETLAFEGKELLWWFIHHNALNAHDTTVCSLHWYLGHFYRSLRCLGRFNRSLSQVMVILPFSSIISFIFYKIFKYMRCATLHNDNFFV